MRASPLARAFLGALAFAAASSAQIPLTLRDAVARALSSHPLLAVETARIASAEGARRQAQLPPNPRLVLQHENARPYFNPPFRYWQDTDTFAYLQQPLETAGKRGFRTEVAQGGVIRAELTRELLSRQIAARVKLAYWLAAGAHRIHALLAQSQKNFGQIIEYHEARVREGAMAEADLIRVRLEGERLAVAANAALLDAERARIHLFREMGQNEFPDAALADSIEDGMQDAAAVLAADAAKALEQRPELKLAKAVVDQTRANLRLQQAITRPNIEAVFGYKRTAGLNTTVGGVQMDLPFFNRNQGNLAGAEADIRVAESNVAATEALIRAEVRAAQAEFEIRRRQVEMSLKPMLDRANQSSQIALAAYREGGADLLRLLDAERVRIETEILYVRTLAEFRQSIAALEAALGVTP
jgi:outer membrane protein, heavy metal efflux system